MTYFKNQTNRMPLSIIFFLVLVFINPLCAHSQTPKGEYRIEIEYFNATSFTIVGKAMDTPNPYHRIDGEKSPQLPDNVRDLYTHSAGLAISFVTNSHEIKVKWQTPQKVAHANLTPIAQKGLDLYIKQGEKWVFAGAANPRGNSTEFSMVKNMDGRSKECLIFLPLYSPLLELEIGVENDAKISAGKDPFRHKIAVYGSSIVHGASASRPGLAYPAIMSRMTGLNFINMGISGNAKLQPGTVEMLTYMNADAYVLDCIPNCSPQEIKKLLGPFVKNLREGNPKAPIILVQTIVRPMGNFNLNVKRFEEEKRNATRLEATKLMNDVENFYFIDGEDFLGTDGEGSTDGIHPTDVGFKRMVDSFGLQIIDILKKHGIE